MKTFWSIILVLHASITMCAQVGINTTSPDASAMLDISSSDKGVLVPRLSLSNVTLTTLDGTNASATGLLIYNTNASVIGGNGVGFYMFNGTVWEKITTSTDSNGDADFYEEGTTTAPDAISDDIYTQGNLAIGKTTADYPLDVETDNTAGLNVLLNGNLTTSTSGINIENASTSSNILNGITANLSGNGNTNQNGVTVNFNSTGNGSRVGYRSGFSPAISSSSDYYGLLSSSNMNGSGNAFGVYNSLNDSSNANSNVKYGVYNVIGGFGGARYGIYSEISPSSNSDSYGLYSEFEARSSGNIYGSYSVFTENGVGEHYGTYSELSGTGFGLQTGVYTSINNSGNGIHYGTYSELTGSGFGDKYSSFNTISGSAGGTHYGVYSSVLKPGSYAGYFLGNVSIGTTVANNYIFPSTRGTLNQIMQTDASGNLNWVDVSSITTDDADFYEEGTTTAPDAISDDIYTQGNLAIGKTTADYPLDVSSTSGRTINTTITSNNNIDNYNVYNTTTNDGIGNSTGVINRIDGTGSGDHTGTFQLIEGTGNGSKIGVRNLLSVTTPGAVYGVSSDITASGSIGVYGVSTRMSNSGSGNQLGTHNVFVGSGTGDKYGVANYFTDSSNGILFGLRTENQNNGNGIHYGTFNSMTGSGSGTKYGNRTYIAPGAGGDLFGIYSEVLRTTGVSYAGYFLGDVAIGTTATNTYVLPESRGAINQIMQSDGAGNVSWVDPNSIASVVAANNGLNLNGTNVQLGGNLNQNTTISAGANNFQIDLNGSGAFTINDQGVPHFEMAINGESSFGDDTIWRDGNATSGTVFARISDDANDGRFRLYENGITSLDFDANTQFVFNEQGLDRNFRIESNNQTNMLLVDASTDRIGIKENLPLADLHLKQSSLIEAGPGGMIFESSLNSNYWKIYHSGSHFSFVENGVRRAYVEAATGNYVITSDRRLKKNIEILNPVINKLKTIELYRFHYRNQNESDKKILGVMAQDLIEQFPELVSTNEDGYFGVNYDGLSVLAIKAVKEQQDVIEALVKQNEALLKTNSEILKRLEAIENK